MDLSEFFADPFMRVLLLLRELDRERPMLRPGPRQLFMFP